VCTHTRLPSPIVSYTLSILIIIAGYSTFGDVCHGNILLNYHPDDILSTLGRVATWFSILFGFPLVMAGAREGLIGTASSLGFPQLGADANHFRLVASLLAFTTFVSCTVQDVSLVVGLTGAAMGSFIVYICPALIYTKAVRLVKGQDSTAYQRSKINLAMVPFGILIGGLGVYMTIKESS
jgi:amino acid permease